MTNSCDGFGHLSVWIGDLGKNCKMSDTTWYVTIYDCDDNPLNYCGKLYAVLPAPCGHLEVDLPPGSYRVSAVWSYVPSAYVYYGNHFTDSTLVTICCGKCECIELYNPVIHRCGKIFAQAIKDLIIQWKNAPGGVLVTPGGQIKSYAQVQEQLDLALKNANNAIRLLTEVLDKDTYPTPVPL